jgi:TonB-dependent receptor
MCAFAATTPAIAQDNTKTTTGGSIANSTSPTQPNAAAANTTSTAAPVNARNAIVITGIRQSLRNSQQIKRNSDTVVDAITAQDIGALPDRSVTEALQRVPGVAINRFQGTSDPDHFSVEGSGVTIRGLTFVASEFNGRDTFSTGVYGQGINFQDVPAELLGSVEVYKEETADRIEGGLSGTVNMNLRLPFDNKGFHVGYDLEANYGDMARKWSPVGSLLVSDNWDTGIGRIGLLGAFSYSQLYSRSDAIRISNFQTRDGNYTNNNSSGTPSGICRQPLPSNTNATGFPPIIPENGNFSPCYGAASGPPDAFADFLQGTYYAPVGGQFQTETHDRKRRGIAGAAQWQSNDRRALLTAQFLNSKATETWGENTMGVGSDLSEYNTYPLGCQQNGNGIQGRPRAECRINSSGNFFFGNNAEGQGYNPLAGQSFPNYQYDANNIFERGYITLPGSGWRTAGSGSSTTRVPTGGMQQSLDARQVDDRNTVQDMSLNFKFSPTPHWDINLDAQYVKATHDDLDMEISSSNFADQMVDLTGQFPVVTPHKPNTLSATWAAPNPAMVADTDAQYFADPRFTFWRNAMDHIEHSRGHEWAFAGDVAYNFLDTVPFLKQLKFGARYADRQQDIKYTTYNWGSLSEVWSGSGPAIFLDQVGVPQGAVQTYTWDNFFRGQTQMPPAALFYGGNLTQGYAQAIAFAQMVQAAEHAACGCTSTTSWAPLAQRPGVVAGTPFLPSEIQPVSQKTDDAYAMLRFGQDEPIFGGVRLDGNIGVRYVRDDLTSSGSIGAPTANAAGVGDAQNNPIPFTTRCAQLGPPPGSPPGTPPPALPGICAIGPAAYAQLQTFATGQTTPNTAVNKYSYWLPSLNLRFGLTRDLIFRLAASKDFARPALADIRNFVQTGLDQASLQLTANAGNPFLKPITSDNFDATLEWYFGGSRVGSLTFDVFYKSIHNYIFQHATSREVTSNGVTLPVAVRGPDNFTGTGKVKGFEVSYTQTFDFLPYFLSGFGLSANYAYVQSKGIPNSFLNTGAGVNVPPTGVSGNLPLAQLSKHTINIEPFYEKGPLSIRLAYNWRSKFLLTEADVIFPYFPIFQKAYGTLDASAFYAITPYLKVGVQAQNLTNAVTETVQQFTLTGLQGPRSDVMQDRRYSLIVRGTFGGGSRAAPPPPPPALPPPPPEPAPTQTCGDGTVIAATATCPAPTPAPPPAPKPERG